MGCRRRRRPEGEREQDAQAGCDLFEQVEGTLDPPLVAPEGQLGGQLERPVRWGPRGGAGAGGRTNCGL